MTECAALWQLYMRRKAAKLEAGPGIVSTACQIEGNWKRKTFCFTPFSSTPLVRRGYTAGAGGPNAGSEGGAVCTDGTSAVRRGVLQPPRPGGAG